MVASCDLEEPGCQIQASRSCRTATCIYTTTYSLTAYSMMFLFCNLQEPECQIEALKKLQDGYVYLYNHLHSHSLEREREYLKRDFECSCKSKGYFNLTSQQYIIMYFIIFLSILFYEYKPCPRVFNLWTRGASPEPEVAAEAVIGIV
ncbi:uncharacterized protein H6S33_013165 [Morchella sextelata]|uniref:uncharacterized protein n=1 Tax=Morchella sextelata TaxID=1174677 RepID=UPI001D036262|nr:uncharacterized protein H6S33_013165 [Morchella sextelata]KAH0609679.1 hypothetical protein H6S33_013165 [Morchella sextelata]